MMSAAQEFQAMKTIICVKVKEWVVKGAINSTIANISNQHIISCERCLRFKAEYIGVQPLELLRALL